MALKSTLLAFRSTNPSADVTVHGPLSAETDNQHILILLMNLYYENLTNLISQPFTIKYTNVRPP